MLNTHHLASLGPYKAVQSSVMHKNAYMDMVEYQPRPRRCVVKEKFQKQIAENR